MFEWKNPHLCCPIWVRSSTPVPVVRSDEKLLTQHRHSQFFSDAWLQFPHGVLMHAVKNRSKTVRIRYIGVWSGRIRRVCPCFHGHHSTACTSLGVCTSLAFLILPSKDGAATWMQSPSVSSGLTLASRTSPDIFCTITLWSQWQDWRSSRLNPFFRYYDTIDYICLMPRSGTHITE